MIHPGDPPGIALVIGRKRLAGVPAAPILGSRDGAGMPGLSGAIKAKRP
jgi:hypothetical protein